MEKKRFVLSSTFHRPKLIAGVLSRQVYSPYRSAKPSLILTDSRCLKQKLGRGSAMRSGKRRLTSQKHRGFLSIEASTSDSAHSRYTSNLPDMSENFVRTPSTIKEEEPLLCDLDESLDDYFNLDPRRFNQTPMPSLKTPEIRTANRYRIQCEIMPSRSDTPEIPTRNKENVAEVKLPAVENKKKTRNPGRLRSNSPMIAKARARAEGLYIEKRTIVFKKNK